MLAGFLGSIVFLVSFANPAPADESGISQTQDVKFIDTSTRSLKVFAGLRGLDTESPSREFIGFHSQATGDSASVEFFSRWNQYDAWIEGFNCRNSEAAVDCLKVSSQPRCFYSPDTGKFSIADAIDAIHLSLNMLVEPSGLEAPALRSLKFWQSGRALYGKILTAEHEQGSPGTRFLCAKLEAGLQCMKHDRTENEP